MTDDSARPLRVVEVDESDPMTVQELQSHGNALLIKVARSARSALRASTKLDILYDTRSYKIRDIEQMQRQADEARVQWQAVTGLLDELLREFHNANRAYKGRR